MTRRVSAIILTIVAALTAAGFSALVAAGSQVSGWSDLAAKRPERLTLVYVGAGDCAPCRIWRREQAPLLKSPSFARLVYREVKSPSVLDLVADEYWPDDLRGLRGQLAPNVGVPLWFVIADGAIVSQAHGASQWETTILPKLRSLLR